jgi:hypothetical protein
VAAVSSGNDGATAPTIPSFVNLGAVWNCWAHGEESRAPVRNWY